MFVFLKSNLLTFIFIFFALISSLKVFGQSDISASYKMLEEAAFFENYEVRQKLKETIFAPFLVVLNTSQEIHNQAGRKLPVRFEVRKTAEHFYMLFLNEFNYSFPVWGRGSYILKRDVLSGNFIQLKIFLQNDKGSYVRLFPVGDRTRMDVYLFGSLIYESILIPVTFEQIILAPFSKLLNLTTDSIDWNSLFTNVFWPEWDKVRSMVKVIEPYLDEMIEIDDGAQNEFGDFVFIESEAMQEQNLGMNCSGFTKWIGDGLFSAYNDENSENAPYMDIDILKKPRSKHDDNNPWNANNLDRDPYFGLDWIRNIASVLYEKKTGIKSELKDFDVNNTPFFNYVEDVGYAIGDLSAVLYLQAIRNPGSFYLGAINTEFGSDPVLRQYRHVSAFFPWFSEDGEFHVSVMDTGIKKFVITLEGQFPGAFVQLVEIEGNANLSLPPIKK